MMSEKGVEFKGGSLMTVLAVLTVSAVLDGALPSFGLPYEIEGNDATMGGFDGCRA